VNFAPGKIPSGARLSENVYVVYQFSRYWACVADADIIFCPVVSSFFLYGRPME